MRRRSPLFWLGMFWLLRRVMRGGLWGRRYGYGGGYRGNGGYRDFGGYRRGRRFDYL